MRNRSRLDLILEKIPPLLTWALIFFPLWGGLFFPDFTAYIIIICNVYFLYKSISFTVFLFFSLIRLRESESINWLNQLQELENPDLAITKLQQKLQLVNSLDVNKTEDWTPLLKEKLNILIINRIPKFIEQLFRHYEKRKLKKFIEKRIRQIEEIKLNGIKYNWKELRQIIIIPHWKEPLTVLLETMEKLKSSNFPLNKVNIVLAAEARDPNGLDYSLQLQKEYSQYFENIWVTSHVLTENEIVGKSSNMAFAGKEVSKKIRELNWDPKKILITSCDADSQLPHDYFANLAYLYCITPDALYKFYTGLVLLYANIWKLPFYARVKNSMSTMFIAGRMVRTDKLVPFSTYSVSLWLVEQIGYWSPDVTPEDYHIFLKSLFAFPDKVSTVAIFQRIMADAAEGETHLETIKNNYFQERRWSWGISDDGWVIKQIITATFSHKLTFNSAYKSLHVLWDHIIGPGLALLILVGSNIPLLINQRFANTVLGLNLPFVSSFFINITLAFFIFSIILDTYLKPLPPGKNSIIKNIFRVLEWIIQPITGIFLVALPGIEAHTRLLFGKYLEYYLTKKK